MNNFVFTVRFFTRLPIFMKYGHTGKLAKAAIFFPIIGLIIGVVLATFWFLLSQILNPSIAAALTLLAGLLLTGALHEDGLADCADGLGGGYTKSRILEIMRDSNIGVFGAVALIMSVILRWSALAELQVIQGIAALLIAHMASRSAITIALATSTYARDEGIASGVSEGIGKTEFIFILITTLLIAFLIGNITGLVAALIGLILAVLFLATLNRRLGGYTGDGLGAMQQICEIAIFICFSSPFAN